MKTKYSLLVYICTLAFALVSCDDDPTLIGESINQLTNDCIKRSLPLAPNIVGNEIEFAYAMAIPDNLGKLASAQVVASIAGANGTHFDPNSYHTSNAGIDVPVLVAADSETNGATTSIQFTKDTCAATLRFYYIIPEEARDREVSFTFSVKSNNGQTAEYKLGPYKIARMDMTKNQKLVSGEKCYLSFQNDSEAIHIYSTEDLQNDASLASKIDIVYAYNSKSDINHAFYTPTSPETVRPDVTFPSGFSNDTKMIKVYGLRDRQLSDLQYSNFIDDVDFKEKDYSNSSNYLLRLLEEGGIWVETSDAKYRAFIYVNKISANNMTISVKRYRM